jgi:hypothetical protein
MQERAVDADVEWSDRTTPIAFDHEDVATVERKAVSGPDPAVESAGLQPQHSGLVVDEHDVAGPKHDSGAPVDGDHIHDGALPEHRQPPDKRNRSLHR